MGIYLPQGHVSTFVNIDVDGATLQALGCAKTPEILFRDLVERCDGIAGVVFDRGSQANGTNVRQLNTSFSDASDVANARAGLLLDWADCSTKFLNLTPQTTTGSPTLAVYLRLMVGQVGAFGPGGRSCPTSLLV